MGDEDRTQHELHNNYDVMYCLNWVYCIPELEEDHLPRRPTLGHQISDIPSKLRLFQDFCAHGSASSKYTGMRARTSSRGGYRVKGESGITMVHNGGYVFLTVWGGEHSSVFGCTCSGGKGDQISCDTAYQLSRVLGNPLPHPHHVFARWGRSPTSALKFN